MSELREGAMEYPQLEHFLRAYLSAEDEGRIAEAIRNYVDEEGQTASIELRNELKAFLAAGTPMEELVRLFGTEGRFTLDQDPTSPRLMLLELFANLQ